MYVYSVYRFYVCCSDCGGGVCGNVCCVADVVKDIVFILGVLKYVVCLCKGCDGCCVFCFIVRCMGSVSVVIQMLYVCVNPVAVLNASFCMTCSLLILVEDERGDHMEEASSRPGHITVL